MTITSGASIISRFLSMLAIVCASLVLAGCTKTGLEQVPIAPPPPPGTRLVTRALLASPDGASLAVAVALVPKGSLLGDCLTVIDTTSWSPVCQYPGEGRQLRPIIWLTRERLLYNDWCLLSGRRSTFVWDTTHDLQTGFPAKLGDKSTFFVSDHWLVHLGWVRRGKPTSEPGPGESGFPRLCMYDLQEQRAAYLGTFSSHVVAVPVGVWAPSGNEPPEVFVFVAQLEKPGASTPSNTALVAVSVPGGTIRPVMSLPGCSHRVALGGAGDTLAIGVRTADNDATDLHIYSESGGQPRVATSISDAVLELEWSPDGKLVLALGVRSLWCFDPATCHLQNLLVDDTKADEACWLGDSKHIIAARGDRLWLIEPESETTKPVFDLNRLGVPGT